jgi:predicted dithiol-disulfide oxidoreductase (DUF899 family)
MTNHHQAKNEEKAMAKTDLPPNTPLIVPPTEWDTARERLLVKEKELTHARDALAAERRRMPWMAVEKAYVFDGPKGKMSLLDLFEGRRQRARLSRLLPQRRYDDSRHAGCRRSRTAKGDPRDARLPVRPSADSR